MNEINETADKLIRHYKSLLTYSEINIEDNNVKLGRAARKLAIDECTKTMNYIQQLLSKFSNVNGGNDNIPCQVLLNKEHRFWNSVKQILEDENS